MWTGGCCTAPSQISFGMWNPTILSLFKYGLLSHSLLGQVPPNGMVSMGIAVSYHLPSGYNLKLLKIIDPKLWMIFFSSRPHVQVIFGPQWIQWDGIPHFLARPVAVRYLQMAGAPQPSQNPMVDACHFNDHLRLILLTYGSLDRKWRSVGMA